MALLVTDQGEIDSLRTLLNATHNIPRNLVLKLYTSNNDPLEADVPTNSDYFEPYDASNASGYGAAPTTGYPEVKNNRVEEDQDFTEQYGILLNGNRWTIGTTVTAQTTASATGTSGTYAIVVDDATGIKKGDYVTGAGIANNTYVVDIQGLNLELSQQNQSALSNDTLSFGRGRTTASYPEQVFTFSAAAGSVYGYYLSRANNMPYQLQGVVDGGSVAAGTTILKTGCKGVISKNYVNLLNVNVTQAATGTSGTFELAVTSATAVKADQRVTGTGVAAGTIVVGKSGNTVYLSKALTSAVSNDVVFAVNVAEELTPGQVVSKLVDASNSGPDSFLAGTTIIGIDYETETGEIGPRVYLSQPLQDNIGTASDNDQVNFDFSVVTSDPGGSALDHNLNPGDVIYVAQGSTSTIAAAHYTVFEVPSSSTFTTTPAMQGTGDSTLYSSIFFAERFTNGPYAIQNDGDQIKVTLNVSLD
tara:strand:+ start:740 stop:2164 length:1425 start_codon:yes stop_codon:yes gene_type:complete